MKILACAGTDIGHYRKRNEDSYLVGTFAGRDKRTTFSISNTDKDFRKFGFIAAVADGMGGYADGDKASFILSNYIAEHYYSESRVHNTDNAVKEDLNDIVRAGHNHLVGLARENELTDMCGTTIVGFAWYPMHDPVIFHSGDSRAVLVRNGELSHLTRDHSVMASLLAREDLSVEQAIRMPGARSLTSALGPVSKYELEISAPMSVKPGDRILLCSDGLFAYGGGMKESTLHDELKKPLPADKLVPGLIDAGLKADGNDNITVVVIDFMPD